MNRRKKNPKFRRLIRRLVLVTAYYPPNNSNAQTHKLSISSPVFEIEAKPNSLGPTASGLRHIGKERMPTRRQVRITLPAPK